MTTRARAPFMSITEAGRRIGVKQARAYQLAAAKLIPTVQLTPNRRVVPVDAFEAWVAKKAAEALASVREPERPAK